MYILYIYIYIHTYIHISKQNATGHLIVYQFSSVAQLCLTLCDPMNRSMPGLPVE